jgi:hypothetical protein
MAKITLDEMVNVLRTNTDISKKAFEKASKEIRWYKEDATGAGQYMIDLGLVSLPAGTNAPDNGYVDNNFKNLPVEAKRALVAELVRESYQNKETGRNFILGGIGSSLLATGLWLGSALMPSVSIDEAATKYDIKRQKSEVAQYVKQYGARPSWELSEDQIREENTTHYGGLKSFMNWMGLFSLLGAIGSGAFGAYKRFKK